MAIALAMATSLLGAAFASLLAGGPLLWTRLRHQPFWRQAFPLLGLCLGYWSAWPALYGRRAPDLPPVDSNHWLFWLLLPALGLAWLQAADKLTGRWLWGARTLLLTALAGLITRPLLLRPDTRLGAVVIVAAAVLLLPLWLRRLDDWQQVPRGTAPALALLLIWGSAAALLLGSSASLQQQSLILGASLLPSLLWMGPGRESSAPLAWPGLLGFGLSGLWISALCYSSLPPWAVLLLAGGLSPLLLRWTALDQRSRAQQGWAVVGLAFSWIAALLTLLWLTRPPLYLG